ncbi:MAG: carboxylesterase family protein [Proteobacteria bacterium]|nr:carboxylesterase family protein [Pseudomonadota bacterium]
MATTIVKTAVGEFEGYFSDQTKSIGIFKGIPYAEPPEGERRFRPPVPKAPLKARYLAQQPGSPCWQPQGKNAFVWSLGDFPRSEDCLYLNIWTPGVSEAAWSDLPVMVWFHGGSHTQSWAHHPLFDGEKFARQGIVVVTVNYRLGPWGFLALPMLSAESPHQASGNYGLLDKILALHWVQQHIMAFGGDPNRVTVFGQSAGAQSICALMASPLAEGLFHQAIGQSASCLQGFEQDPNGYETGARLLAEIGGPKSVEALREVPNSVLLSAVEKSGWAARSRITIDGWVLREPPLARFQSGLAISVPLLVGSLANEGLHLIPLRDDTDEKTFNDFLAHNFKSQPDVAANIKAAYQEEIKQGYPVARHAIETDRFMAFGMRHWAALNARSGAKSFVYFMQHVPPACRIYQPDSPQLSLPEGPRSAGAYHSGELAYVFDNQDLTGCGWEPDDRALAREVNALWAGFVKYGQPGSDDTLLWPPWSEAGEVMVLDRPLTLSVDVKGRKLAALAVGLGVSLDPSP